MGWGGRATVCSAEDSSAELELCTLMGSSYGLELAHRGCLRLHHCRLWDHSAAAAVVWPDASLAQLHMTDCHVKGQLPSPPPSTFRRPPLPPTSRQSAPFRM